MGGLRQRRRTTDTEVRRRDGHLVVYVGWPIVGGLGMGLVLALCVGIVVALVTRGAWAVVGVWLAISFALVTAGTSAGLFWYAAREWRGPRQAERIEELRQGWVDDAEEGRDDPAPTDGEPWRVVRPYGTRALPASVELEVRGLEPAVRPEVLELYEFVVNVWPGGNVSRGRCRELGYMRSMWERLVGGQREMAGQESGRGLLDRGGYVYRDGAGTWQISPGATLERVLGMNEELRAYAEGRAQLVRIGRDLRRAPTAGRDGRDGTGRTVDGGTVSGVGGGGEV